eukprot:TRINITY_DN2927_c0_g1_i1.p1 TRINITY_DN2927_c0_g1~~TRINITY_DN2927_c0_g1_i1.p1  ORF type:complete len:340 (-),score=58.28 TRINITY_DN2927_c0_g1_i1:36-1004(-)
MFARFFSNTHRAYSAFYKSSSFSTGKTKTTSILLPLGLSAVGLFALLGVSKNFGKQKVSAEQTTEPPKALSDPSKWESFELLGVLPISHNTSIFRFKLDSLDQTLGLPTASCIVTKANINGKEVIRPYTPITGTFDLGYFDLLVKDYPKGVMSRHIHSLKPGDRLEVKGPIVKLAYKPNMRQKIGMLAGGTGITPMLQIIRAVLENNEDNTQLSLIFANNTERDILLKEQLDFLEQEFPNFKVFYTIAQKSRSWNGGVGRVSEEMITQNLPSPSENPLVLVCGPDGFVEFLAGPKGPRPGTQGPFGGLLKKLGYLEEDVFKF